MFRYISEMLSRSSLPHVADHQMVRTEQQPRRDGIPLEDSTWETLSELTVHFGLGRGG